MVVQYILASRTVTRNKENISGVQESETPKKPENESCEEKKDLEELVENIEQKDKTPPPADEELENSVIETEKKIIDEEEKVEDKSDENVEEVEEYYVKYRNFSYLHCEWKTEEELFKGDKRIAAKLKRFKQKMAHNTNIFENVS